MCAACARVFELLDNQRSAAFAHDEAVPQRIKWTTRQSGFTRPSAHSLDDVERANCDGRKRRFGSACHDYICEIVANITQRFANGDGATGATVRIGRADAAKAE